MAPVMRTEASREWRVERALGAAAALAGTCFAPHPATAYLLILLAVGALLDDGAVPLFYAALLAVITLGLWMVAPLLAAKAFVVALVGIRTALVVRRSEVLPTVDVIAICLVVLLAHSIGSAIAAVAVIVLGVLLAARLSVQRRVPLLPFAAIAAVVAVLL